MITIHASVAAARERLRQAGIPPDEADMDARLLAEFVLGWTTERFFTDAHTPPPAGFEVRFASLIARRAAREPYAYIVGHQEFWGLRFDVTPAVLIPRPETELIVEAVLEYVDHASAVRIVDVGTGSGCLAVAIARERPAAAIVAADISENAIAISRRNCARHGVASRISLCRVDLLDGLSGPFDVVVSNPPYVREIDRIDMQPEVRWEPPDALFAGIDGLNVIRRLLPQATERLKPGGLLMFEMGFGQSDAVAGLISATPGITMVELRSDLQNIPRVAIARRTSTFMSPCLFCSIINHEINASIVYEDDLVVAFNDINPQAPTHVLIVPRRHIASLSDLTADDNELVGELVRRAAAIAKDRGLAADGFRTVFNTNRDAGQTVFHIHLHLLGGRTMHWPPG
jgi:release factor glutamine methyltransferase